MTDVELLEAREEFISEAQRYGYALDHERRPTLTEQTESDVLDGFARGRRAWWQHDHVRAGDRWFAEVRVYVPSLSGITAVHLAKDPRTSFAGESDARACAVEMVREYLAGTLRLTNGAVVSTPL